MSDISLGPPSTAQRVQTLVETLWRVPVTIEMAAAFTSYEVATTDGPARMTVGELQDGIDAVTRYFEATALLRPDPNHISAIDVRLAALHMRGNGGALLRLMIDDPNVYVGLKSMQREGFGHDAQLSMRDLYAARRGTGYDKAPLDDEIARLRLAVRTRP